MYTEILQIHTTVTLPSLLPPPLRPLLLFYLGILLFSLNLHGLELYGISTTSLLQSSIPLCHNRLYKLFVYLLVGFWTPCLVGYNLFLFYSGWEVHRINDLWTSISLILAIVIWVCPTKRFFGKERFCLLRALGKVIFSSFHSDVTFSSTLLADILTSYSRVFGDLFSGVWQALFYTPTSPVLWSDVLTPLIMALPFLFRLKQCTSQYFESSTSKYQHLGNALKYASAFPVLFLSPIISKLPLDSDSELDKGLKNYQWIYYSWLGFVLINSLYSFYWDVVMDWDLGYLYQPQPKSPHTPATTSLLFLRPKLHFIDPFIYYLIVIIDLFLRVTWLLKLVRRGDINHAPLSDFIFEMMELTRRWLWVYLRIEKQHLHVNHRQIE